MPELNGSGAPSTLSVPQQTSSDAAVCASKTAGRNYDRRAARSTPRLTRERPGRPWLNSASKLAALFLATVTGTAMLWIGVPPVFASSPPTVTGVIASSGPTSGGQQVTVTGANLASPTSVKFGTSSATIVSSTATTDTVTSPSGTLGSTVDVTVTTPSGSSALTAADEFTYEAAPAVTAVSPGAGLSAGGTSVTIVGTGFADATQVSFASLTASFIVISGTEIDATSPSGSGVSDITVTTPVGTSPVSSADEFTYEDVPVVTALSPAAGPTEGGTPVTIIGTGFVGVTAVYFGTVPAATYSVTSDTEITATSPADASGTTDVEVTNAVGASATSAADQFTFEVAPTISAVIPTAGLPSGGTSVSLTGTNFTGATEVDFGAVGATSYVIESPTSMLVTSPPGSPGSVDITVTNPVGTSATETADQFAYETAPTVSALSPDSGSPAGDIEVTLTGTNFIGASAVEFGSTPATSYTVDSSTEITASAPPQPVSSVQVTVTTPVGTSATVPADEFTYELTPTSTSLSTSPTSTQTYEGSVTISATLSAGASGTVDFKYSADGTTFTAVPTCSAQAVSSSSAACTTTALPGGTGYLEAVYSGDADYASSTSASYPFSVTPAAQAITFTSRPPVAPSVGGTYTISATSPGGMVSFTLDNASTGCSLDGAVVSFTAVGTCIIDASSPASSDYLAASASQHIVVNPPPTGPGLGSISSVTATPGDRQALVSWSAPSNISGFANVSYTVTASPGGANCLTVGALRCLVTGLSDSVSYSFIVAASSDDPSFSSISSEASSPVTPTAAPIETGTTTNPELGPGSAEVISSSGAVTEVGVTMSGDSVTAAGQGLKLAIATSATTGKGAHATVVLIKGGTAWFSGSGFLPGSTIDIFAFSRGTLLGTAVAKANGKYSAALGVPTALAVGSHTIQLQGFASSGNRLAVAVGVAVRKSVKLSLVIAKFGVCSPNLKASMKAQLKKLAATILAQGASSVVITGYTYSTGTWAKTLSRTQASRVASYLRAGLKHLGYKKTLHIVIRVARAASQTLSRRVTMAVTLG